MKPIRYFGDIGWFSQRSTKTSYGTVWNALRAHLNYIGRSSRKDLSYVEGLDKETWKEITERETSRRWDSRVAGKVILALPNDLSLEQAKSLIREFVSKEIGSSRFGFALHRPKGVVSGKDNFHAHILFSARGRNGKKLRLNPSKLGELQRKWDKYLKRYTGHDPFRSPERMRKHIRPYHLRPDSALYDPKAVEYIKARRRAWVLLKEAYQSEIKVSLHGEAAACSPPPVSRRPSASSPASSELSMKGTSSSQERKRQGVGRETSFLVQLDRPFQEMPTLSFGSTPLSKIREQIRLLEGEKRSLEWELESTSRLSVLKRMKLKQEIKALESKIESLEKEGKKMSRFDEMTRKWLKEHIEMLYMRKDTSPWIHQVAILAVNPKTEDRKQFLVKIQDLESRIGYLRKLNAEGYNIYASVNVLHPEAKSRKAEDFLPYQVAVYLDLDSKQKSASELWKEIWKEIRAGRLPEPSWVIKSSKGNYQVYWIFKEPVEAWKLRVIMEGLNRRFGLDHTQDVARVFRLPGLRNRKPGKDDLAQPPRGDVIWINKEKGYRVKITKRKYSRETLEAMLITWGNEGLDLKKASEGSRRPSEGRKETKIRPSIDLELEGLYKALYVKRDRYRSLSEMDAAFVTKALLSGYSPQRVADFLALQREDKPDPLYYAYRTVEEVSKWLREKKVKRVGQSLTAGREQELRRRETNDPGPNL